MKKTTNKVVLIGSGQVGLGFIWSAINQGVAAEYAIIDLDEGSAKGNKFDLEDAQGNLPHNFTVEAGGYDLVKNADVVVITAGRAQQPGETRLDLIGSNAKIMSSIGKQVKANGFDGITVIASNPVDILATIYMEATGFVPNKVISSGCTLDSARLRNELSQIFGVTPADITAYTLGEHGDSSISTFEFGSIKGIPMKPMYKEKNLTEEKLALLHENVWKRAYKIIEGKKFTNFGVGAALANITKAIINNELKIMPVGTFLNGEYGELGVHASVPCLIGANGIEKTYEIPLSDKELKGFKNSVKVLKENLKVAHNALK